MFIPNVYRVTFEGISSAAATEPGTFPKSPATTVSVIFSTQSTSRFESRPLKRGWMSTDLNLWSSTQSHGAASGSVPLVLAYTSSHRFPSLIASPTTFFIIFPWSTLGPPRLSSWFQTSCISYIFHCIQLYGRQCFWCLYSSCFGRILDCSSLEALK